MDSQTPLEQAMQAAWRGDKARARAILSEVLQGEPRNEAAWLLFAYAAEKDEHAIYCLQQAIGLSPDNTAALERLKELQSSRPAHPARQTDQQPAVKQDEAAQKIERSAASQAVGPIARETTIEQANDEAARPPVQSSPPQSQIMPVLRRNDPGCCCRLPILRARPETNAASGTPPHYGFSENSAEEGRY